MTRPLIALSLALALASSAAAAAPLRLERVVMVMRHGIRPPTSATPAPAGYTRDVWPKWPVDFGLLTPNGAKGATLLGAADAAHFRRRGLLPAGCPAPGSIVLKSSNKPRSWATAAAWAAGAAPGCPAPAVDHPGEQDPDPIFHGLDDKPASFDGARAFAAARALLPNGGMAAETRRYRPQLELLARALDCRRPCPVLAEPSRLTAEAHDRPSIAGPLDEGSSIAQTFLLEYLEGMPLRDVAWGRASRADIERMLALHTLKFRYANRPTYVARAAAAPLVAEIRAALSSAAKVTLLAGHDTNLADLGGYYRLHWRVPGYPADDIPPGSAIGFELLRDVRGQRFVRAFYRAQAMDQLRALSAEPPFRQYLAIPGCGNSPAPTACPLARFLRL